MRTGCTIGYYFNVEQTAMHQILYRFILGKALFVGFLFASVSPLLLLTWALEGEHEAVLSALRWLTIPLAFASLVGSWWAGAAAARYMVDEKQLFLDALKLTWVDLKVNLSYVPLLGLWFTPDEDKTKNDDD